MEKYTSALIAVLVGSALVAGCGAESPPHDFSLEKRTAALVPAPYTNSLPEPGATWRKSAAMFLSMPEGLGPAGYCPEPIIQILPGTTVPALTTIKLDGTQSIPRTGVITKYLWSVQQPAGNLFNLVPTMMFPEPSHEANAPGDYRYCLDVWDEAHGSMEPGCYATACVNVEVQQKKKIRIVLTWNTPGDPNQFDEGENAGADMDLHFLHQDATGPDVDGNGEPDGWFDLAYDCFWYNPAPEWESMNPNVNDNPHLDHDDSDGAGPEEVSLAEPVEDRTYKVGVHYWNAHGFGPSYPRVKIYILDELVFDEDLFDFLPMETCDLWEVATIDWPSGEVTPILEPNGDPKILKVYQNPAFVQIGGITCP